MNKRRDLVANTIIKSIVFIAIIVSIIYILKPLTNGIVIDRINLDDGSRLLIYGKFNLSLLKLLSIISLIGISFIFIANTFRSILLLSRKDLEVNNMQRDNKLFIAIEFILLILILLFHVWLLLLFPRSVDRFNSSAFGFSLAIVIMVITLLIASIYISSNKEKPKKVKKMDIAIVAEASVLAALSIVLSLTSKMIPGLQMPNGGSISLSMLPLFIFALRRGAFPGLIVGMVYGFVNFLTDGYILHWGSIFFDYLLPFSLLAAVAGLFHKKAIKGLVQYTVIAVLLGGLVRYLFHGFSGVIFFAEMAEGSNPWFYSFIIYNLPYMLASTLGSLVFTLLLQKRLITLDSRIQ